MSQRTLISGWAGFLGQKVCAALAAEGFTERYVLRKAALDLTEQADVRRLMAEQKPDVIVHLAAVVGGIGANRENLGLYFYQNAARAGCIPVYHATQVVRQERLKGARWVDPADHGFDPKRTLEFAIL